jgi:hypothetical protein
VLVINRPFGTSIILDFSKMTDAELHALRDEPVCVTFAGSRPRSGARLEVVASDPVKVFRAEIWLEKHPGRERPGEHAISKPTNPYRPVCQESRVDP